MNIQLVESIDDLIENLTLFESYLSFGSEDEQKKALSYIRLGRNFICYNVNGELHFAPSRYIGYINNTFEKHEKNKGDGKQTSPAICCLLKKNFSSKEKKQIGLHITKS